MPKARSPLDQFASASPISALATAFQDYLFFPDPYPLYALMGALAGNMLMGNPVWLMLVGPPSCGKTALLESMYQIPGMHIVSSISSEGALLSGSDKKSTAKGATGGLLRVVGDHGCICIKDFTSILSMEHSQLKSIVAAFRDIYDGRWCRQVGTDGGKELDWTGKMAMMAACTDSIDQFQSEFHEMGERWVFCRYPDSDGFGETKKALDGSDPERNRLDIQQYMAGFFSAMNMDWYPRLARTPTAREWLRFSAIASIAVRCRSNTRRDWRTGYMTDIPQPENPTRLATNLQQIYMGLEQLGMDERARWDVVRRVGLDCMPRRKKRVFDVVRRKSASGDGALVDEIQAGFRVDRKIIAAMLEDLCEYGVVEAVKGENGNGVGMVKTRYRLSRWGEHEIVKGWGRV